MRKNNPSRMTVVEQLVKIREDVCVYACKYREDAQERHGGDMTMVRLEVQRYCHDCPLAKVHFDRKQLY